jgi:hypothetical protein
VAVALDASDPTFVNYDFQNYGEDECSKVNQTSNSIFADHSTLLVGYIQYDLNSEILRWKIKYNYNNICINNLNYNKILFELEINGEMIGLIFFFCL